LILAQRLKLPLRIGSNSASAHPQDKPAIKVTPLNCLLGSLNCLSEFEISAAKTARVVPQLDAAANRWQHALGYQEKS
jgi:hypothetical protein